MGHVGVDRVCMWMWGELWAPIRRLDHVVVVVVVIMQNSLKSLACVGAQGHEAHNASEEGAAGGVWWLCGVCEVVRMCGSRQQDINWLGNAVHYSEKRLWLKTWVPINSVLILALVLFNLKYYFLMVAKYKVHLSLAEDFISSFWVIPFKIVQIFKSQI